MPRATHLNPRAANVARAGVQYPFQSFGIGPTGRWGNMPTRRFGYVSSMTQDDTTTPAEEAEDPGTGSGDGDSLGTPSGLPEEAPPGADQEANEAVSGGGMVDPSTEGEAKDTADPD
ncbi:MAG TPA: hypothetical protein VMZ66_09650 [Aeromicrobium sp.]|nr:hypothetical protein [Aeromicrobium sp.]